MGAQLAEGPGGIFPMGCWPQRNNWVLRKKVLWHLKGHPHKNAGGREQKGNPRAALGSWE